MSTPFNCKCGNTDPRHTKRYDGSLGYEAVICRTCGRYSDHTGWHPSNRWSRHAVALPRRRPFINGAFNYDKQRKSTTALTA